MKRSELALRAHEALHSSNTELVLTNTSWKIRIVPNKGNRCVSVYSGDDRFYFQVQDAWDANSDLALLARMGHRVTRCTMRVSVEDPDTGKRGHEILTPVIIDGQFVEDWDEAKAEGELVG